MKNIAALRINMTDDPNATPEQVSARYQAAVEMAAYADSHQFKVVSLEEHHCADNGWLPSPLIMAAAIAARTKAISINVTALLVTLYDPLRLAEDIAVIDLLSAGRFSFVAGMGYRPEEYHAMNKDYDRRGQLMDEVIEVLLKAWSGEEFSYRGRTVNIRPLPLSRPHPFFFVGGMSKAAARRAAKFGLPFYPPMAMPELEKLYYKELEKHGNSGFVYYPKEANSMLFIDDDPERAWRELAPYFLNETREYGSWKRDDVRRPSEDNITTLDGLRSHKRFEIMTPQQCLDRLRENERYTVVCHPLVGGLPIEKGWHYLSNFVDKVWLPHTESNRP